MHISKLLKDFMRFYRDFEWQKQLVDVVKGQPGLTTYQALAHDIHMKWGQNHENYHSKSHLEAT